MTHPDQSILALYAGQDLGWFRHRRTERHLAGCAECRGEVEAFEAARDTLVSISELPVIPWNRLALEMKANIRLGLAAGECVRGESPGGRVGLLEMFSGARVLTASASVMALLAAGLVLERPLPRTIPAAIAQGAVLRATATGIELVQGGQTLSLRHVPSAGVTYSAGAQGSIGAGYVDSDTGNVTINNLYVQ